MPTFPSRPLSFTALESRQLLANAGAQEITEATPETTFEDLLEPTIAYGQAFLVSAACGALSLAIALDHSAHAKALAAGVNNHPAPSIPQFMKLPAAVVGIGMAQIPFYQSTLSYNWVERIALPVIGELMGAGAYCIFKHGFRSHAHAD